MVDDIENLYALVYAVAVAVDTDIFLLILAVVLLYCIVGILSLKAKGSQASSQEDLNHLRGEVRRLAEQVEASRRDLNERSRVEAAEAVKVLEAPTERPLPPVAPEVMVTPEVVVVPVEAVPAPPATPEVKPAPVVDKVVPDKGEVSTIAKGMAKSRTSFLGKIKSLVTGRKSVDSSSLDGLEEMLITSDVGARVADSLVSSVRERASQQEEVTESVLRDLLNAGIRKELIPVATDHRVYQPVGTPLVILVVGVNGVGKTTTVAKLATRYQEQGKKVVAIAADTFRAAAVQQLQEWGNRTGFSVYSGAENAKPAAVVFDGMVAAKEQGADVVLIDTAGRLHTKSNLMQELEGVRNSIRRHVSDAPHETLLVVDGVSGQNALSQAREFNASTPLTGLVVTKLDGTPKGGIIVAISQELKIPVFYVGVGEKAHDLLPFSVDEFVQGLLSEEGESNVALPPRSSLSGGGEVTTAL
jgi:fused signal recognition particle receptor